MAEQAVETQLAVMGEKLGALEADVSDIRGGIRDIQQSLTTFIETQNKIDRRVLILENRPAPKCEEQAKEINGIKTRLAKVETNRADKIALGGSILALLAWLWRLLPAIMIAVLLAVMLILGAGCKNARSFSWHKNGQMATASYDDGFIEWSAGDNKRLPLSEINVNGLGM